MIRLITFDLDNTLWDVASVIGAAERTLTAWLTEHAPEVAAIYGTETAQRVRQELVRATPSLAHDLSALRVAVLRSLTTTAGYAPTAAGRLAEEAFEVFMHARHDVDYFDGALEVLDALSARYRLGALTNGNAAIDRLGLTRYFEFAFSAADVGASKPAPELFRRALDHTGVLAEHAIHVGDHLVDDVAGAGAVGMHTILVEIKPHAPLRDGAVPGTPSRRVSRLIDITRCIDELIDEAG